MSIPFGVQSYCFRHFKDNKEVARRVSGLGLDQIELCAVHVDFNDLPACREVVGIYRDAGISVVSIGVQTFVGDDKEEQWFEAAAAAGARHISAHFRVESFTKAVPRVRAWCRQFGIRVGIHCHGGYMFGGQPDVLEYLMALGGPEIGLCIDTAWAMQIGPHRGNPVEWARKYAGHIYGIHFKDFTFGTNGGWKDTVVGTGNLDLPGFVAELERGGFDGMAVVEYEADVENPDAALGRCVASMRTALADPK